MCVARINDVTLNDHETLCALPRGEGIRISKIEGVMYKHEEVATQEERDLRFGQGKALCSGSPRAVLNFSLAVSKFCFMKS